MAELLSLLSSDYLIHLAILVGIYLILAQGLNVNFGLGGQLNLAHVATYAIGAYTTALLATELGRGTLVCFAASMIISGFFALTIGAISLKLKHDYFVLGTLAFASIVSAVLVNWKSLTRGVLGIPGIPRPELFGHQFDENSSFLVMTSVIATVSLLFIYLIFHSSLARTLRAQSEHAFATMSLGKNVRYAVNVSFILSSMFAGLAGSLFAYYINYIDPSSFNLHEMVFVLSIVIVGKPGSFWGVTAATIFLVLLPEPLRFIEMSPAVVGPMRQMLYAVILYGVLYWKRSTLFPVQREI